MANIKQIDITEEIEDVSLRILTYYQDQGHDNMLEAVVLFCEEYDIDLLSLKNELDDNIKGIIELQSEKLNLLKGSTARLIF